MSQDHEPREAATGSRCLYEGRVVNLRVDTVRLADGKTATREVVEHHGAVAMVALLPGPQVLLVRQWRYAAGEELLEIPAGTLESGEQPLDCARRELIEETGYKAGRLEPLAAFYTTPGFTTELMRVFLATDLTPARAAPDEDERIEVTPVAWDEAVAMCLDGRIRDGKTIAGILAADRAARGFAACRHENRADPLQPS
jgi:ADP-ribose pyrophosphatase